jgi:ESCRT-I complex subunit TSG101
MGRDSRYASPAPSSSVYARQGAPPPPLPQQLHRNALNYQHNGSPGPETPDDYVAHQRTGSIPRPPGPPDGVYAQPQVGQVYQGAPSPYPAQPHHPGYVQPAYMTNPQQGAQVVPAPKQPKVDLMDSPLEVSLPSQNSPAVPQPAPPIPPNPEKDALLQALSATLRSQIEQTIAQNAAAVPALESQHVALQQAHQNMQSELYQLDELEKMLASNEKILRESMQEADRVAESVRQREVPSVDEVLVAPTVVGEQLYQLVAEERSISDAMFLLARALDNGRVGADVFVKQTRNLAREQFLKKALINKISEGMGLTLD